MDIREEIKQRVLFGSDGKPRPSIVDFVAGPNALYPQAFANIDHLMLATPQEIEDNTVDCHNCPVSLACKGGAEEGDVYVCCGMVGYRVDPTDQPPDQTKKWLYIDCNKHQFQRTGNHEVPKDQCEACNDTDGVMGDPAVNYECEMGVGFLITKNSIIPPNHRLKVYGKQRTRWGEIDVEIGKEDTRLSKEKR